MKLFTKITLFIALLGLFSTSYAQYFQHLYGNAFTSPIDRADDGNRLYANQFGGYMITGTGEVPALGVQYPAVVVTDAQGQVTSPTTFKNYYAVQNAAGTLMRALDCYGSEIQWGNYAIAGTAADTNRLNDCIYYARLDPAGNIINSTTYALGPNYYSPKVRELVPDSTRDHIYLVGDAWATHPYNSSVVFAMKLRYDGVVIWSELYDLSATGNYDDLAYDGVVAPFNYEFAIVGSTYNSLWPSVPAGYIFVLDAATGSPASSHPDIALFNDPAGFSLNAAAFAGRALIPGPYGFIAAGNTAGQMGNPAALYIDLSLNLASTYHKTYATWATNLDSRPTDIQWRINTAGADEYWMAGETRAGYFGGTDIEVWKLTDTMNVIGHYVYGDIASHDDVRALDITYLNDGMALFGSSDYMSANFDLQLTKAYFSGQVPKGCNWQVNNAAATNAINTSLIPAASPIGDHFVDIGGGVTYQHIMSDVQRCYANAIAGANNFKVTATHGTTASDDIELLVTNSSGGNSTMEVALTDVLGRTLIQTSFAVGEGENTLSLALPRSSLATGLYFIRWQAAGQCGTQKIWTK